MKSLLILNTLSRAEKTKADSKKLKPIEELII